jgi:hypothetical protein
MVEPSRELCERLEGLLGAGGVVVEHAGRP